MIRILHAADLHLDSPFAALRPEQATARRREQRELIDRLVQTCAEKDCQLLLLAGDLFDSDHVYPETVDCLRKSLSQCGAQVFISPGNHDFYSPWSAYAAADRPDNVHIFSTQAIRAVKLAEPAVTVYGAAFTGPKSPSLLTGFRADPSDGLSLMVIHGDISSGPSDYNRISVEDVRDSGLDYLALGHIHRESLRRVGKTTVAIPGCAMGRGFDELGEKGAFYVELDRESCRVSPVCLGARQYRILRVEIDGDPLKSILQALPAQTERDICRILLTGNTEAPDLKRLEAALRSRFYSLELVDQTLPPLELWSAIDEDSLKGEFLRQLRLIYDNSEADRRSNAAHAAALGLALMEGREVPEC